jgi:hypothetical protein
VNVIRWFLCGPSKPDPWDEQTASDLREGNGSPLCHRCLNPHDPLLNFCPDCGAPVGKYTNLLPFLYPFSVGHTMRIGTSGTFKRSPLIIIGFVVASLAYVAFIAPFYWLRLLRNIFNQTPADSSTDETGKSNSQDANP